MLAQVKYSLNRISQISFLDYLGLTIGYYTRRLLISIPKDFGNSHLDDLTELVWSLRLLIR